MPSDFAGNTLNTSRSISLASTSNFSDWVGSSDTNDFYRFNVTSRGTVGLTLSGLSNDADLRLIQDRNNNGAIEAGEILASSALGGTQVDRISRMLDAGTYFIAVDRYSGDTFYNLQTQFQPVDGAGDTLAGARGISVGPTTVSFTDQIGGADPSDYYRFTLNNTSDFRLGMAGMTADADVQLLNSSGAVITSSTAGGRANESIISQLNAGTYYVRVYPYGGANTNYTLSLSATATTPVGDWFSQNLRDTSLANMARTFAADGSLSRNDMLGLFRDSQDGSIVDSNETADLRTLVANSGRFQMTDSVRWLSNQVATGAGSSMAANTFESNLVGRWFLGSIAPTAMFNSQALTYTFAQGSLFGSSGQARIGDIDQGRFGDCAFLAALGATFAPQSSDSGNRSSATINSMITDNGDNTYTMRFYNPLGNGQAEAQYVTVDRRIATANGQSPFGAQTNGSIWTALAERAYAQWREWREGQPGYNLMGNGDHPDRPLQFITGRTAVAYGYGANSIGSFASCSFSQIISSLQNGRAITTARYQSSDSSLIVGGHAYSITNAYTDSLGQQRVVVRNPWGVDNHWNQPNVGADDGFLDISFSEFQRSFDHVGIA